MSVDPTRIDSIPVPSVPRSPLGPPGQEIRFAVVMYGGISLAIYIHGVAQELLRLVRATSGADVDSDAVAQIYREMSDRVRDQDQPDQRCPTRFVIDVLSGTSAGGINAVFLAKALAIRSKDLENLRQTWLETADMDKILNRRGSPTRSLLNGNWMYQKLYKAFNDMNTGPRDEARGYAPVEQLDLFVTTTDLNGVSIPIRLADMDIPEKVNKGYFNFRCDNIQLAGGPIADPLDDDLDSLQRNDFEQPLDAMLAFACRCTSSFPIAFAPVKLADIEPVIGAAAYEQFKERYCKFFHWIPPTPLIPTQNPLAVEERELADGGYLDNKPFNHVIDALSFRATMRRHTRKLFFVDPFPEIAGDAVDQSHFDFLENAIAGSMTLPHYQTIREEIDRVKTLNRTQERLRKLQERTMRERPRVEFEATTVDTLTERYGSVYGTYHVVRLFDCTDDLAHTFCGLPASVPSDDSFLAVRYLVRAWREATYAPNGEEGKRLENEFFTDFDFSFRVRRAVHLLEWAQHEKKPELCALLIRHLTRLNRRREQLSFVDKTNPIWPAVVELGKGLTWDRLKSILEPITDDDRMVRAKKLYFENKPAIEKAADAVRRCWQQVFDLNRGELTASRDRDPRFEDEYQAFDYRDMVSLAFLEGSDVSEHAEAEIYRISPADGIPRPLTKKLAGYAVQAFGAFLKLEWRQNDILWGRLDACERIVSAVLNHHADTSLRDDFVTRLQDAIVRQEANLRSTQDLAPAMQAIANHRLRAYMRDQYVLPDGPAPKNSARQIASAADIFGRMIEEDVGQRNRLTALLRRGGGFAAQLVGLLTPGSLGRVFWNYWLALFGVTAGLLFVLAWIAGQTQARTLGVYGMGATVLIWFLSRIIGNLLAGLKIPRLVIRLVKWLLAIAVVALILTGLVHLPRDAYDLWQRIWHPGGRS